MNKLSFLLVFMSLFSHAYWNFLVKSSDKKTIFVGLSKIVEVIMFMIPGFYMIANSNLNPYLIGMVIFGAVVTFLNYLFLSKAYVHGDLSMAYPIARSGILFLPFLSWIVIGEQINITGWIAVGLILLGTIVMHLESFAAQSWKQLLGNLKNASTGYALLAAFTVACYTLLGKIAVTLMEPFLYLYLYTAITAMMYIGLITKTHSVYDVREEWKAHRLKIIQVGFFNTFSFLLALLALTMSKATYVGGLRQLSVIVGLFLGFRHLREPVSIPKIVGVVVSILGGALIYFAK